MSVRFISPDNGRLHLKYALYMWRCIYLFLYVKLLYQLRILDILMIFEGYELNVVRGTS